MCIDISLTLPLTPPLPHPSLTPPPSHPLSHTPSLTPPLSHPLSPNAVPQFQHGRRPCRTKDPNRPVHSQPSGHVQWLCVREGRCVFDSRCHATHLFRSISVMVVDQTCVVLPNDPSMCANQDVLFLGTSKSIHAHIHFLGTSKPFHAHIHTY